MRRMWTLALIILSIQARAADARDFEIDVNLFKGEPKGSRETGTLKRLAAPKTIVKSGEDASVLVGGEVLVGGKFVPVGQQIRVLAKDAGQGAIVVSLSLENRVLSSPKAGQVTATKAQATATIQSGSTMRLELGDDPKNKVWVEITIHDPK